MTAAKIPAPGIVLGHYPERRNIKPPSLLWVALRSLANRFYIPKTIAYRRFAERVAVNLHKLETLNLEVLQIQIRELQARLARDGFIDNLLVEVFAHVAEISKRELGIGPYNTQIIAARIILDNQLAEMATGEGKTLAAGIAAAVAALAGVPVHVVTSNDYLVERDASTLLPLFRALGLKVGTITQGMNASDRKSAYACNITYCTAKELVFDYLRDGLAEPRRSDLEQRAAYINSQGQTKTLMRGLCMAIIDEADSILIDEACVPFVLSRTVMSSNDQTGSMPAWALSEKLYIHQHFTVDQATRKILLTDAGRNILQQSFAESPTQWLSLRHCEDVVKTALVARHLLHRDRDYLIKAGKIYIIDGTTGRISEGRAWSRGLHQMVEAKENCAPTSQTSPVTQITYQRFFPRYLRLGGMSGTLLEARTELMKVYELGVTCVPLRTPSQRTELPTKSFATKQMLWKATLEKVKALHSEGRPVLVGTHSVADSDELSHLLQSANLPHTILNARQDETEAQVIATAGYIGSICVATNMAGRGTDIALNKEIAHLGGLHVISCQQNLSKRIDRQLFGRCARQGDPGSAELFISLDGPLLSNHWSGRIARRLIPAITPHSGRSALLALRLAQWSEERHLRFERKMMLKKDNEMARWFTFSGQES